MPRRPRSSSLTSFFHVINRSAGRQPIFLKRQDYRAFRNVLRTGLEKHPVRLVSYCVLPNHWHLIVGPVAPPQLTKLLHWVTTTHAVRWRKHRKTVGEGPVYQGRFKAIPIESMDALMRSCRYVERNALRAGLVARAQDWPWSSLNDRLLPTTALPLVDTPFLVSDHWLDYVNHPRTPDELLGRPGTEAARSVENRPVPLHDTAEQPGSVGGRLERGEDAVNVSGSGDQDEADAHVEGAKRLRILKPARMLKPREERRNGPTSAVK
jgi:putative transposase